MSKVYDSLIIGCGISAIHLARDLKAQGEDVLIVEKSRNIGGRIATRRFQGHHFSLSLNNFKATTIELKKLVALGLKSNTLKIKDSKVHPVIDFNSWTKELTKELNPKLGFEVERIKTDDEQCCVSAINGDAIYAKKVILTAPAPQAFNILKKSSLVHHILNDVEYSRDIFYFTRTSMPISNQGFQTIDQFRKGDYVYSQFKYLNWNEKTRAELKEEFDSLFLPLESFAHKWRYSKVVKKIHPRYQLSFKDKHIFLVGDYFFGDTLNDAISSSRFLLNYFNS